MDSDDDEVAARRLRQIALALGIPTEAFFGSEPACPEAGSAAAQEVELLRLFRRVREADARRRCLAIVRGIADQACAGEASGA